MRVKDVNIKNRTYYFFNDIIYIESFNPNNIKIDEKSYKNILICYIGYVAIKHSKYVKISSANPLYPYFQESQLILTLKELMEINILTLVPTNESKESMK